MMRLLKAIFLGVLLLYSSSCGSPPNDGLATSSTVRVTIPCNVPVIEQRIVIKKSEFELIDETKKYKVTSTEFRSLQPMSFVPQNVVSDLTSDPQTLEFIDEFSYHGRVFAYKIYGRESKPRSDGGNSGHLHLFVLTCIDSNGDGDFELISERDGIRVPTWAIERSNVEK